MMAAGSAPQESFSAGWYGKIPGTGDFIARRMPSSFSEAWDRWLQAAIAGSRERLGGRARSARARRAPRRTDFRVARRGIRDVRALPAPLRGAAAGRAVQRHDGWPLGRARLGPARRAQRRGRLKVN